MGPSPPTPHERAAALLRRQRSTTARLRAGLPGLLDQLDGLEEPSLPDVELFQISPIDPPDGTTRGVTRDGAEGSTTADGAP